MKTRNYREVFLILFLIASFSNIWAIDRKNQQPVFDSIMTNISGSGIDMTFIFEKGKAHNHPTMAIWIEDVDGNYIQQLFVTKYIASGIFGFGTVNDSVWVNKPGIAYRPAALPYWNHKRIDQPTIEKIMPGKESPVPDAYTSATPPGNFILNTKTNELLKNKFRLLIEINQTWDWNEFWTNNKYSDDQQYKTSSQPSVIYAVTIDPESEISEYWFNPIGHGHYSGENGILYTNLATLTTALEIFNSIKVIFK